MDLTPSVDNLCREFLEMAQARGQEAGDLAATLMTALSSSVRLTLLGAMSDAADEITARLTVGVVEVRLSGVDPTFVVTPLPTIDAFSGDAEDIGTAMDDADDAAVRQPGNDEDATARINFRPPAHLKARIEDAASREGLSVNGWLVRAATAALNPDSSGSQRRARPAGIRRFTGWVR